MLIFFSTLCLYFFVCSNVATTWISLRSINPGILLLNSFLSHGYKHACVAPDCSEEWVLTMSRWSSSWDVYDSGWKPYIHITNLFNACLLNVNRGWMNGMSCFSGSEASCNSLIKIPCFTSTLLLSLLNWCLNDVIRLVYGMSRIFG